MLTGLISKEIPCARKINQKRNNFNSSNPLERKGVVNRPKCPGQYDRNTQYAKKMSKMRSRTVEPVLGTLINFLGLKKIYARGIIAANKHCLMSALCYNLKKLIRFERKLIQPVAKSMKLIKYLPEYLNNSLFIYYHVPNRLVFSKFHSAYFL
jgi:hypothetical protein